MFSRTIDPLDGTFAINELLPVADTVQLPPADAFPQVPARFVRSWGNFVGEQNRGRERNEGETFVTAFRASPLPRGRERGEHTGCVFQRGEYAGDQRYILWYNVDFTCKSERIIKATRRLYLI